MATKRCTKCGRELDLGEFYRFGRDTERRSGKCKRCTCRDVRANYREHRAERAAYERQRTQNPGRRAKALEYQRRRRSEHPDRYAARSAVGNALRDGRLTRRPCEVCGTTERVQAHHDDYSKPLDVRWLCFRCHRGVHGQVVLDE